MSTTTLFSMARDINGYNTFSIPFSNNKYSATLAAGVGASITVPSDSEIYLALFLIAPGSRIWVALNTSAAVPGGGSFTTTASELNPAIRTVNASDVISCLTADTTADIGIAFYALQ